MAKETLNVDRKKWSCVVLQRSPILIRVELRSQGVWSVKCHQVTYLSAVACRLSRTRFVHMHVSQHSGRFGTESDVFIAFLNHAAPRRPIQWTLYSRTTFPQPHDFLKANDPVVGNHLSYLLHVRGHGKWNKNLICIWFTFGSLACELVSRHGQFGFEIAILLFLHDTLTVTCAYTY